MEIYHNPRCRKSRETLRLIQQHGKEVKIIEYLKTTLDQKQLESIIKRLGVDPCTLLRRQEKIYKELYRGKELSKDQCIQAMIDHPVLMERPIVVDQDRAVLGRPPENVLELI